MNTMFPHSTPSFSVVYFCNTVKSGFTPAMCDSLAYSSISIPVYGPQKLPNLFFTIINTPEFQRLRQLKQLGLCETMFIGATHTRFEHSLGVACLAFKWANALDTEQVLTLQEKLCVGIAGLCHDLGHTPLSHVLEELFRDHIFKYPDFCHEHMSMLLIDHIYHKYTHVQEAFNQANLQEEHVQLIKQLIAGHAKTYPSARFGWPEWVECSPAKQFLYEIVANKRNGIDVDRMDYFVRDAHHVGNKTDFNPDTLLNWATVYDGRIAFHVDAAYDVYCMFETRFKLYKKTYHHPAVVAAEVFITQTLQDEWRESMALLHDDRDGTTVAQCSLFVRLCTALQQCVEAEDWTGACEVYAKLTDAQIHSLSIDGLPQTQDRFAQFMHREHPRFREKFELHDSHRHERYLMRSLENRDQYTSKVIYIHFGQGDNHPLAEVTFVGGCGEEVYFKSIDMGETIPSRFSERWLFLFYPRDVPSPELQDASAPYSS